MVQRKIAKILKDQLRKDIPQFSPGDTIKIKLKVVEGEKTRYQSIEGVVIRKRGEGPGETFTIRRISYGVGIEQTLPIHSPNIESIKVLYYGRVRRAKLYYLRKSLGKAKLKQKMIKKT